jgi:hypothetical protein
VEIRKGLGSSSTIIHKIGEYLSESSQYKYMVSNVPYRSEQVFAGSNYLHFSSEKVNYITLPIIPPKSQT